MRALFLFASLFSLTLLVNAAPKPLQIYFIDVMGGQATLFVAPSGQSLLIDAGWPGFSNRDALRIAAAAKAAKVKKIDYLLVTHHHLDHVGGVPQLIEKIPVGTFVDHGPNRETGKQADKLFAEYEKAVSTGQRLIVKAGDTVPIKGLDVKVVTADGGEIKTPLSGGGQPNQFCAGVQKKDADPSENARSVGTVITFGKLRVLDLGDLTWNKELDLVCPENKVGKVDVFVVSHHGLDASNSPALVHAVQPRVAVMNNGSKKGGKPAAWDIVKASPGLEDFWQLHFSIEGGTAHNSPDTLIANLDDADSGHYIKLTANENGSFEIYNSRNKFKKDYAAK